MAALLNVPTGKLAIGVYPEREDSPEPPLDGFANRLVQSVRQRVWPTLKRLQKVVGQAERLADEVARLDDAALSQALYALAKPVMSDPRQPGLARGLALLKEAATRSLGVTPYPTQLLGAALLLGGRLAEMQTGEGKTLTAGLAACLAGVAGIPTHVVTVNDYLAKRDAEKNAPLFAFFQLTAGVVINGMGHDQKREAYACPITYCTNKELVFDYLRDRAASKGRTSPAQLKVMALHGKQVKPLLLRGLHFAIVDETDSILIDEARTPLILSEKAGKAPEPDMYLAALSFAGHLELGDGYLLNAAQKNVTLTPDGKAQLAVLAAEQGGIWLVTQAREQLVRQALAAIHFFHCDHQYLIADNQAHIIDEHTGRILPGRKWEQGLQQMIEAKEGIPLSEPVQTLARITYQRFFARYLRLSGMTGTALEVSGELRHIYRLEVVAVPTYRPCIRKIQPVIFVADEAAKWRVVLNITSDLQGQGIPVLVGTRSVKASEALGQVLAEAGMAFQVLNARQDAQEADVVARAGHVGVVTVATNMAGRGTDIALHPSVREKGGLTVILTEYHDSSRIDRQLVGRCARQGDPGNVVTVVSLTDSLFLEHGGWAHRVLAGRFSRQDKLSAFWAAYLRWHCQRDAERLNYKIRQATLKQDRDLDNTLAFAGNHI